MDDADAAGQLLLAGFETPERTLPSLPGPLKPATEQDAYAI